MSTGVPKERGKRIMSRLSKTDCVSPIAGFFYFRRRTDAMKINRDHLVLTVEGELCAGTEAVARSLAKKLRIPCHTDEILEERVPVGLRCINGSLMSIVVVEKLDYKTVSVPMIPFHVILVALSICRQSHSFKTCLHIFNVIIIQFLCFLV